MPDNEFTWPVRVYYEDTDAGGVVYYANYLKFMERARTEWLRYMGFEQDQLIAEQQTIFAVRKISVDYLRPARFNEQLDVRVRLTGSKGASIFFYPIGRQSIGRGDLRRRDYGRVPGLGFATAQTASA